MYNLVREFHKYLLDMFVKANTPEEEMVIMTIMNQYHRTFGFILPDEDVEDVLEAIRNKYKEGEKDGSKTV